MDQDTFAIFATFLNPQSRGERNLFENAKLIE